MNKSKKTEETLKGDMAKNKEKVQHDEVNETQTQTEPETIIEDKPAEPTAEELIAAEKEKFLRLAAEYDNYRKRTKTERDNLYTEIRTEVISKFLPVYDDLSRAAAVKTEDAAYAKGVEMTLTKLSEILKNLGAEKFGAPGDEFDVNKMNAVAAVQSDEYEAGKVAEVYMPGFSVGGRIVRHAVVTVAE